jgi:hypothetical protein
MLVRERPNSANCSPAAIHNMQNHRGLLIQLRMSYQIIERPNPACPLDFLLFGGLIFVVPLIVAREVSSISLSDYLPSGRIT